MNTFIDILIPVTYTVVIATIALGIFGLVRSIQSTLSLRSKLSDQKRASFEANNKRIQDEIKKANDQTKH